MRNPKVVIEGTSPDDKEVVQFIAGKGEGLVAYVKEVWNFRELYLFLTWRDILVKYKQTVFGVLWVFFQPVLYMLVFTILFNRIVGLKAENIPYPLFVLGGIIPWSFFAGAITRATESLVNSRDILKKVYFPRIIIPCASTTAGLLDMMLSLFLVGGMMIYYSYSLTIKIIFLPLMIFLALVVTIATSLIFSALNVKYRDVRFVIMFLIQVWMYVTPIFYPIDIIPEGRRFIVSLNPMVGVVEGFRYCMLNTPFPTEAFYFSVVYAIFMLIIGQYYFRYMEQSFADVV